MRKSYFIIAAAVCTIIIEFTWTADFFGTSDPNTGRIVFLIFQALFLGIAMALVRTNRSRDWSIFGAAIAGLSMSGSTSMMCAGSARWGRLRGRPIGSRRAATCWCISKRLADPR